VRFIDWLKQECLALDRYDAMCRGEIPPGAVEFAKRDGKKFFEFVQLRKDNADGSRTTVIANVGGLAMLEKDSIGPGGGAAGVQLQELAMTADNAIAKVRDLAKRIDTLTAERADLVEVDPAALVEMFTAAVDEVEADA